MYVPGRDPGGRLLPCSSEHSASRLNPVRLFASWYNGAMAGKNATHKHRNIIDDILDLGLTVASIVWYFVGVELDTETVAMIAGAGASARATLRRILTKMWGDKLGIKAPAEESSSDDSDGDSGDESSDDSEAKPDEADTPSD